MSRIYDYKSYGKKSSKKKRSNNQQDHDYDHYDYEMCKRYLSSCGYETEARRISDLFGL
jgi:hypothetical protein